MDHGKKFFEKSSWHLVVCVVKFFARLQLSIHLLLDKKIPHSNGGVLVSKNRLPRGTHYNTRL